MKKFRRTTFVIPALAFLIILWGILTITASQSVTDHPLALAGRQVLFGLIGLGLLLLTARIRFETHLRWRGIYAALVLILLFLLPVAGTRINGMRGWYLAGPVSIQPSELGKAFFLLALAGTAIRFRNFAWWGGLWIVPVLLQPDFGTAAVYGLSLLLIWLSCGGRWRDAALSAGGALMGGLLFLKLHPYAWKRLQAFWNPAEDPAGSGWHIRQFDLAIAHGHWTGAKLGQTFWSSEYLPLAYNDSTYAAMAETLGFAGTMMALVMYAALYILLLRQAMRKDLSGSARHYLAGASVMLAVQTLLHAGVNTGILPPTGLTLPLASYGGSSLVGTLIMLGMAVSAARSGGPSAVFAIRSEPKSGSKK